MMQYPVTPGDLRELRHLISVGDAQGVKTKTGILLDLIAEYDTAHPCKCDKCDNFFPPEDMWYHADHSYCVECAQDYDVIRFALNHPRAMPAFNLNQISDCFDPSGADPEMTELVEGFLSELEDDLG